MMAQHRWPAVALLAASAALAACEDGLIRPAAPAGPASVSLAASLVLNNGGPAEAYQKVNQLSVRFLAGAEERLAQVVPFNPGAAATVVSLQVPLEDVTETMTIQLELLAGTQALFRGSGQAQLTAGGASEVEIPILPIVSSVTCAGTPFQIAVYNAARRLRAAALFASGDTVPNIAIGWSTSDATVATVNQAGDVFGLRDGTAQVTCSAQGLSGTRQVQVLAVVASVLVQPAVDTTTIGAPVNFAAALRDSLGNAITSPRTTSWTSSNGLVATVNASGQATGVSPGTVTITATSGGVSGSASLLVLAVPPVVRTISGTPAGSGATLQGGVNPQGSATLAWFEWSTSPTLAGAQQSIRQQLAAGFTEQPTTTSLTNLSPGTTYYFRAAGSNSAGVAYGQILNFRSNGPPAVTTLAVTQTGAVITLNGTVNPSGLASNAWFEWGASPVLSDAVATPTQALPAGTTNVGVGAILGSLAAGRTYYYRVAASNQLGTTRGSILSFVAPSPPSVGTQTPTGITGSNATLAGLVNPNGLATNAWFEWGLGSLPTSFTNTTAQAIGSGTGAVSVNQSLGGLSPSTLYSYRVAATNAVGTTRGGLVSFTTGGPPIVRTVGATFVGAGAPIADLTGGVIPNGEATELWMEWYSSDDPNFLNPSTTPRQSVGSGYAEVIRTQQQNVGEYYVYYRAVAQNRFGIRYGTMQILTTIGGP